MENMDKGRLTVPKWVLIVPQKYSQMPQNLSVQFVCPSPKVLNFIENRLHWASEVRDGKGSWNGVVDDFRLLKLSSTHWGKNTFEVAIKSLQNIFSKLSIFETSDETFENISYKLRIQYFNCHFIQYLSPFSRNSSALDMPQYVEMRF